MGDTPNENGGMSWTKQVWVQAYGEREGEPAPKAEPEPEPELELEVELEEPDE